MEGHCSWGKCAMELVEELHVMPRARAGVMGSLTAAAQVSRASEIIGYRSNNTSCRRRLEQYGLAWSAAAVSCELSSALQASQPVPDASCLVAQLLDISV